MNINKKLKIAEQVARQAGLNLLKIFNKVALGNQIKTRDKGLYNLATEADELSEKLILSTIRKNFPEDTILSEESGKIEGNKNTWLIDALDGTGNFTRGIPVFGITIGYIDARKSMFGLAHNPILNTTTCGISGKGAFTNGKPLKINQTKKKKLNTINIIAGFNSPKQRETTIRSHFSGKANRLLSLWCPSLDSVLVAQGYTDAIISLENEIYDQLPGVIIAKEAGCVVKTIDGKNFVLDKIEDYLPIIIIARNKNIYGQVARGVKASLKIT